MTNSALRTPCSTGTLPHTTVMAATIAHRDRATPYHRHRIVRRRVGVDQKKSRHGHQVYPKLTSADRLLLMIIGDHCACSSTLNSAARGDAESDAIARALNLDPASDVQRSRSRATQQDDAERQPARIEPSGCATGRTGTCSWKTGRTPAATLQTPGTCAAPVPAEFERAARPAENRAAVARIRVRQIRRDGPRCRRRSRSSGSIARCCSRSAESSIRRSARSGSRYAPRLPHGYRCATRWA